MPSPWVWKRPPRAPPPGSVRSTRVPAAGGERRAAGRPRTRIVGTMARTSAPAKDSSRPKEPGRLKQMWQVFQMTRRNDKSVVWLILAAFLVPIALGILAAIFLSGGNVVGYVLYILTGIMAGLLFALIVLGRRA